MYTYSSKARPPTNTQRILRWEDFPSPAEAVSYELTDTDGQSRTITLKQGNRRVLEGLMRGPMYCASPVRISDRVMMLKREHGVNVRTELFDGDGSTECERFGVYFLDDLVTPIASRPDEVAA